MTALWHFKPKAMVYHHAHDSYTEGTDFWASTQVTNKVKNRTGKNALN